LSFSRQCPCCGHLTLARRAAFEICAVCYWQDDGQDDADADEVRGGPNNVLSLAAARANYLSCGACEEKMLPNVRAPLESERRL
jgi:Cysteine-rich CPCC